MLYPKVVEVDRGASAGRPSPGGAAQRVALVTGGARGMGREIARRLARDGFAVAVNDLDDHVAAREVVAAIRESGGVADAFIGGVTDERQVADLATAIAGRLGPVDVLVLIAVVPQAETPLAAVPWEDHVAQLELLVKSPVMLGRALLPGMTARRSGRIVQVDCEIVDRPPAGRTAYATAKSAQIGLTRSWARALAPLGVTVNSVASGLAPGQRQADVPPSVRRAVAHAVSFVASETAASITGQHIVVDGGRGLAA